MKMKKTPEEYKMMFWKKGLYLIIALIMLGLTLKAASATTWTQYTPGTGASAFNKVFSLNNNRAFTFYCSSCTNISNTWYYNETAWEEINTPHYYFNTPSFEFTNAAKIDDLVFLLYKNNSGHIKVIIFNSNNKNYSEYYTSTDVTFYNGVKIGCIENSEICYVAPKNVSGYGIYKIYPSFESTFNTTTRWYPIQYSSYSTFFADSYMVCQWNGVGCTNRSAKTAADARAFFWDSNKAIISSSASGPAGFWQWNNSNGTFQNMLSTNISGINGTQAYMVTGYDIYFINSTGGSRGIWTFNYNNNASVYNTLNATNILYDIDYNSQSGRGWAVGFGGIIYDYNATATAGTNYTLYVRSDTNPTIKGVNTYFYATASNAYGNANSNITITFYDSVGNDIYHWQWLNAQNNIEASNLIDAIAWTNIPVGAYNVSLNSTYDGTTYAYTSMSWSVISSPVNGSAINYSWITNNITGNYTDIKGITSAGSDNSYAVAKKFNGSIVILGINHNNPALSTITEYSNVTTDNNAAELTSISAYQYRLYAGADIGIRVYNTSSTGSAAELDYVGTGSWNIIEDYTRDVTAVNDTYAWACVNSPLPLIGDVEPLYNYSTNDYDSYNLGSSNCKSILYDSGQDLVIVHAGTTNANIYNSSDQALLSTITFSGASATSTQDLIDISGTWLFLLTNYQTLSKYNITDPANPVLNATCKTDRNIQSIEALSDAEVIIGATNKISVCDFNNSLSYDYGLGSYVATTLKSIEDELVCDDSNCTQTEVTAIYEISGNTANKFMFSTGKKLYVAIYERQNETITENYPPTITDLTISDNTPCINQNIRIVINAQDYENDEIVYDFYCDGTHNTMYNEYTYNEFYCNYATTGTKTLTAFAKDHEGSPNITRYTSNINVDNCTANNTLFFNVEDKETGQPIQGAIVTLLNDGQISTTDNEGNGYFATSENSPYNVTATHPDYYDFIQTGIYSTNFKLLMTPKISGTGTILIVNVYNDTGNPLPGLIVSANNIDTMENLYSVTDENGRAIISNMFATNRLLVTTGSSQYIHLEETQIITDTHYGAQSVLTTISQGETKYMTFNLSLIQGATYLTRTNRSCVDTIQADGGGAKGTYGVWLCGEMSLIGSGDTCNADIDCLSKHCSTYNHQCSHFNWSICDEGRKTLFQGMGRSNHCFISASAYGILRGVTGMMLDYFILVIVIIIFAVLFFIIRKRK